VLQREQFLDDLCDEVEKDIRQRFAAGAVRVSIDFTEGRLANKNDSRNPWTNKDMLQEFIDLNDRVIDRFSADERRNIGIHTCRTSRATSRCRRSPRGSRAPAWPPRSWAYRHHTERRARPGPTTGRSDACSDGAGRRGRCPDPQIDHAFGDHGYGQSAPTQTPDALARHGTTRARRPSSRTASPPRCGRRRVGTRSGDRPPRAPGARRRRRP
jgi:hypothetical protein